MSERLTDRLVRTLKWPAAGYRINWDSEIKGLGLRVTTTGAKSFILNYRASGRSRRYTIGAYPDWSVAAAREEAKRLKRDIDRGRDPMAERHEERTAPTMADLAERYLQEHAVKKRENSRREDSSMLTNLVLPRLGTSKVVLVTHSDIERLHRKVSEQAPYRANRMLALLSKMFALAVKWDWRNDNPVKGIERNSEAKRTRYLSVDELRRLSAVLGEHPNKCSANAIRLLLLTGARRGEVLSAKWEQFDLGAGVWIKSSAHTKQQREHRVPLSSPTLQLLNEMRRIGDKTSPYLFPSKSSDRPLRDLKKSWASIRKKAGIVDCRMHDLRHTYASILASSGLSLPIIGALLGHTQPNTTARYSHLYDDPLREATERVGALVSALDRDEPAEVLKFGPKS